MGSNSPIHPLEAARIVLGPARRPIIQLLSTIGIAAAFPLLLMGLFAEPARDPNRSRYLAATLQIKKLNDALQQYHADCGQYPGVGDGLAGFVFGRGTAGWKGPYVQVPLDPWRRPYAYDKLADPPKMLSYGADGVAGGECFNADLSSLSLTPAIPESPYERRRNRLMSSMWLVALFVGCGSIYSLVRVSRPHDPGRPDYQ